MEENMTKVKAAYSCAQRGVWGPYHALVPGPGEVRVNERIIEDRDRSQDKTLCGIRLTDMWERDMVGIDVSWIECKRCRAMLEKQGAFDNHSKLLPREARERIPPLYSNEKADDPTVQAKWFEPRTGWRWYATEGEGENDDWMLFGLVKGFEDELGYFTLSQLEQFGAEYDRHFKPKPLSEVWDKWPFE